MKQAINSEWNITTGLFGLEYQEKATTYETLHRKLKIEQREPTKTGGELGCSVLNVRVVFETLHPAS